MRYVKKPIPVNAIQWDGNPYIAEFPKGVLHDVYLLNDNDTIGYIRTREGNVTIHKGDWIVGPGAEGEYWPVAQSIFAKTYITADKVHRFDYEDADSLSVDIMDFITELTNGSVDWDNDQLCDKLCDVIRGYSSGDYRNYN